MFLSECHTCHALRTRRPRRDDGIESWKCYQIISAVCVGPLRHTPHMTGKQSEIKPSGCPRGNTETELCTVETERKRK